MTDDKKYLLSKPEQAFKAWSKWIGIVIVFVGMFFALVKGQDVDMIIYIIGGTLAGVGQAMDIADKFKR